MKSLIKKIFFKKINPKIFFGVGIPNDQIEEKVFLKNGVHQLDISDRHNIVCQTPFCIAVWIDESDIISFNIDKLKLIIEKRNKLIASLHITLIKSLDESNGTIFIFKIIKVKCYQLNFLHQYILLDLLSSKKKHCYLESLVYGAMYSYPRRVIVTSFRDHEYYNLFPMDFQGEYPEVNIYLLGLKKTNITINKIIESKRVVVSTTEAIGTKTIYALGAHHSKSPPKIEDLSFKVIESELLKFPVPEFSSSYKEIEIISNYELGSHIMLVGKVVNSVVLKESYSSLYHVHFFEYLQSGYLEA